MGKMSNNDQSYKPNRKCKSENGVKQRDGIRRLGEALIQTRVPGYTRFQVPKVGGVSIPIYMDPWIYQVPGAEARRIKYPYIHGPLDIPGSRCRSQEE
jgi:hypothetical protein